MTRSFALSGIELNVDATGLHLWTRRLAVSITLVSQRHAGWWWQSDRDMPGRTIEAQLGRLSLVASSKQAVADGTVLASSLAGSR